tara:strand:+ start:8776 stop:9003 length:228 start_codon:yes stop_codon:yes gene_type:complete
MADNAQAKSESVEVENLTLKGKIHAEQYNRLKAQRVQHEVEIEKIDVLMNYYTGTIKAEAEKFKEENKDKPEEKK